MVNLGLVHDEMSMHKRWFSNFLISTFKLPTEWTPQKDNRYCIYSKGDFIFEKYIYLEEHQLIQKKGFIFPCNNIYFVGGCLGNIPAIFFKLVW
jgi:hypothetical protein